MSTSAPTPPRADTPTDFREDLTADTPPDVNKDTPPDSSKDTTNTDRHKETPPPTDHNPTTDTQAIILVTPLPHPTDPLISLQRLQIPTHHLTTLIPPTDWHTSAITTHLGLPLKLARYPLLSPAANKIPNPCMIGFSMCCEGDEFGKVAWTKVLGAVAVARVDGADVGVEEVADVVRYVNFLGEGLRGVREGVEGGMRGWEREVRGRVREGDGVGALREERGRVREGLRGRLVREWGGAGWVGVEAFERWREGEGEVVVGERVDEVIEGSGVV